VEGQQRAALSEPEGEKQGFYVPGRIVATMVEAAPSGSGRPAYPLPLVVSLRPGTFTGGRVGDVFAGEGLGIYAFKSELLEAFRDPASLPSDKGDLVPKAYRARDWNDRKR